MFTKSARFYDAIYQFRDYRHEVELLHRLIREHRPGAGKLLDVACGTGKHIEYLREFYDTEGLDINPELLQIASDRCPGIPFHEADMTRFDLGKKFDVVCCLFSSIAYVRTTEMLQGAVDAMAFHLQPGGLLIVEPWIYPDRYWKGKLIANFADLDDLKISWMYLQEMDEMASVFDIHYQVGTSEGISEFSERHVMGLWTDEEYREAFSKAGINARFEEKGFIGRGVYYGKLQ